MSDYKIIESKVQFILESEVRLAMSEGWEPVGSLSVENEWFPGAYDTRPTFRQPMLHRTKGHALLDSGVPPANDVRWRWADQLPRFDPGGPEGTCSWSDRAEDPPDKIAIEPEIQEQVLR